MASSDENSGCLGLLIQLFMGNSEKKAAVTFPYLVRDDFLSAAEISLYHVLRNTLGSDAVVVTKVRLADLFFVQRSNENRGAFNRIALRHIDFLLCHPQTMKPLLGIELDDASHAKDSQKGKDEFLNQVFKAANLPLLRIPAQRGYNPDEIGRKIRALLAAPVATQRVNPSRPLVSAPASPLTTKVAPAQAIPPKCPKCGDQMVLRTVTKGENKGNTFYGCTNYPRCRGVITD